MMTDEQLEKLLDNPKKMEKHIIKEVKKEIQIRLDEFITDRFFAQINQE